MNEAEKFAHDLRIRNLATFARSAAPGDLPRLQQAIALELSRCDDFACSVPATKETTA